MHLFTAGHPSSARRLPVTTFYPPLPIWYATFWLSFYRPILSYLACFSIVKVNHLQPFKGDRSFRSTPQRLACRPKRWPLDLLQSGLLLFSSPPSWKRLSCLRLESPVLHLMLRSPIQEPPDLRRKGPFLSQVYTIPALQRFRLPSKQNHKKWRLQYVIW